MDIILIVTAQTVIFSLGFIIVYKAVKSKKGKVGVVVSKEFFDSAVEASDKLYSGAGGESDKIKAMSKLKREVINHRKEARENVGVSLLF